MAGVSSFAGLTAKMQMTLAAPSYVRLNGEMLDLEGDEFLAQARARVAALRGVSPAQIALFFGTRRLRDGCVPLRDLRPRGGYHAAPGPPHELGAIVTARPLELGVVPRGAGRFRYELRRVEEFRRIHQPLREAVKLPSHVELDAWIAAKTCVILEEIVQVVRLLEGVCTNESCPRMCAGRFEYQWADAQQPTPLALSAPAYIDALLISAVAQLTDEGGDGAAGVDGVDTGLPAGLPTDFPARARALLGRFFRIFAHTYLHHYESLSQGGQGDNVSPSFRHFLFFVREFDLVSLRDMAPLGDLVARFLAQ